MLMVGARTAARFLFQWIVPLIAAVQASGTSGERYDIWLFVPPAIILASAWAAVKFLGGAVGRDQARAFTKGDEFKNAVSHATLAALRSADIRREWGDLVRDMLDNPQFMIILREAINRSFAERVKKQEEYWGKVDRLETRTDGMANAIAQFDATARGMAKIEQAMTQMAGTMTEMSADIRGHRTSMEKFSRDWNPETDEDRRSEGSRRERQGERQGGR